MNIENEDQNILSIKNNDDKESEISFNKKSNDSEVLNQAHSLEKINTFDNGIEIDPHENINELVDNITNLKVKTLDLSRKNLKYIPTNVFKLNDLEVYF